MNGQIKGEFPDPGIKKETPELYADIPICGIITSAVSALIFGHNLKLSVFTPVVLFLILLPIFFKYRKKATVPLELVATVLLFGLSFLLTGGKFPNTTNVNNTASFITPYLAVLLIIVQIIGAYKLKKQEDFYIIYLSSLLTAFISSFFAPLTDDPLNIVFFLAYGFFSILFFIDLIFISYKNTVSNTPFLKRKIIAVLLPLSLIITAGSLFAGKMLKAREPFLMDKLANYMNSISGSAFTSSTTLGTMESNFQPKKIVMKILSNRVGIKIRAKVYNNYRSGRWDGIAVKTAILPLSRPLEDLIENSLEVKSSPVYSLSGIGSGVLNLESGDITVEKFIIYQKKNRILYLPEKAMLASVKADGLELDNLGNIYSDNQDLSDFEIVTINASKTGTIKSLPNYDRMDLEVPDDITPEFREIALGITKKSNTPVAKIFEIEKYFHDNFTYKRGIKLEFKNRMDPVKEFVLYKRPAHCEYFASAMVLMLRSIGIPARYCVGYSVNERKVPGNYCVVREKDAHAWVLAYIPEKGWVEFDPTPPSAIETISDSRETWLELLTTKLEIFLNYLKNGSLKKSINELLSIITLIIWNRNFLFIIIIIAVFYSIFIMRRSLVFLKLFDRFFNKRPDHTDPEEKELRELLARFDSAILKLRIKRSPNLTLLEFADTLDEKEIGEKTEKFRNFLKSYSLARYGSEIVKKDSVIFLRGMLEEII